jgi:hypothetical protein
MITSGGKRKLAKPDLDADTWAGRVNGQDVVPAGGQLEVPTPRG